MSSGVMATIALYDDVEDGAPENNYYQIRVYGNSPE
jgi:hypothetical protein